MTENTDIILKMIDLLRSAYPKPCPVYNRGFFFFAGPCDEATARMFMDQLSGVEQPRANAANSVHDAIRKTR